jgi:hypothetical protein
MKVCSSKRLFFRATLCSLMLFFGIKAHAWVFFITDTNDSTKTTSLRGAIIEANRNGGENTIMLGQEESGWGQNRRPHQWTYHLTIPGPDETNSFTGDLDIVRGKLTVLGIGTNVTIDATGLGDRVFQVCSNAQLTLANIIVKGGATPNNIYPTSQDCEAGGAIYNAGTLVLKYCAIINNSCSSHASWLWTGSDGGGIFNSGTLSMENCLVAGNASGPRANFFFIDLGGSGGGVKNQGYCRMVNCVIRENRSGYGGVYDGINAGGSGGNGAGVFNLGIMDLYRCSISNNLCGSGGIGGFPGGRVPVTAPDMQSGAGGSGGGIYNAGRISLNSCTMNRNSSGNGGDGGSIGGAAGAGGDGGGILNTGSLALNSCTISDNECGNGGAGGNAHNTGAGTGGAGGNGGGICNTGSMDLTSCTIVGNLAGQGGNAGNADDVLKTNSNYFSLSPPGGQGGSGGGVFNNSIDGVVVLRNTLVALNSASVGGLGGTNEFSPSTQPPEAIGNPGATGIGNDLAGNFTSQGFNLIGTADESSLGFTNGLNADKVGSTISPINPLLGPLQMNGGPTPTHALLPGSPAINKGKSFGIHTDQRGLRRPYDHPSTPYAPGGDGSDIGAFELQH